MLRETEAALVAEIRALRVQLRHSEERREAAEAEAGRARRLFIGDRRRREIKTLTPEGDVLDFSADEVLRTEFGYRVVASVEVSPQASWSCDRLRDFRSEIVYVLADALFAALADGKGSEGSMVFPA